MAIIFFVLVAIVGFCSFLIAKRVYLNLKYKKVSAIIFAILSFVVAFTALYVLMLVAYMYMFGLPE